MSFISISVIFYLIIGKKSKIYLKIIPYIFLGLAIFTLFSNLSFLNREKIVKNCYIIPMENELDPNELIYYYDNDIEYIFYIKDNNKKKEIKIPINNVKLNISNEKYAIAKIEYSKLTKIWSLFIGDNKPIILNAELFLIN